jgi:hypothetical protein
LFVAKLSEATVGVAVRPFGAESAAADAVLFPGFAAPPTEPTVHDEVEKIRVGRFAPMPPAQISALPSVPGRTTMTVKNSSAYELSVFFDGPVSKKLILAPGSSQDLDLAPGAFHVAVRAAAANVLPSYREDTYVGSASYTLTLSVEPMGHY